MLSCVALEDDTDELLELIGKSDRLLTPTKHHGHTPGLLMKKRLGGSPYGARLHSSESHSCSDSDSNRSAPFCDEAEAYGGLKVKGNFTPAPVVSQSNRPHPSNSDPPHVPTALKELVQLMQEYVGTCTVKDHDIHVEHNKYLTMFSLMGGRTSPAHQSFKLHFLWEKRK